MEPADIPTSAAVHALAAAAAEQSGVWVERRLGELGAEDIVFPSPRGTGPGAPTTGATPSSLLRSPPAGPTWALAQPGARIEDVSRLMGHSTVRVTQDLYISPDGDLFERFYRATE